MNKVEYGMNKLSRLKKDLREVVNLEKVEIYQNFFKTGKGEYGEGDVFFGITVPASRKIAKKHMNLSFIDTTKLLKSKIHEERFVALLILVERFESTNDKERKRIYEYYLSNTKYVNNWDLVDLSAHKIVGAYLSDKSRAALHNLAKSSLLWDRRISIISTSYFIRNNQFSDTFEISEILLNDKHDLIHKAVGWMLREVGKKDICTEEVFLKKHYKSMPRTMLRYAIEKFPEDLRQRYLKGDV